MDVKQSAHELIDSLPEDATWEDVFYEVYVRHEIELGLGESRKDSVISVEQIRREYNLPS